MFGEINWLATLVAATVAMVIGGLWYSPLLFAHPWMKALGKTADQFGDPKPAMINAMMMNLLAAATLGLILGALHVTRLFDILAVALLLGAGLVVSNQFMRDRFHDMPVAISLINGSNTLVTYLAMGAVFGVLS